MNISYFNNVAINDFIMNISYLNSVAIISFDINSVAIIALAWVKGAGRGYTLLCVIRIPSHVVQMFYCMYIHVVFQVHLLLYV